MKNPTRNILLASLLLIFFGFGCKPDFKPVTVNSGFAVLTYPLYLGGDYMSGFTDGALSPAGQRNSIPYLLNQQLTGVGIKTYYHQHFVSLPEGYGLNFPNDNPKYFNAFHLGYKTDCQGVNSLFPLHDSIATANSLLNSELIYYDFGTHYTAMGIPYAKLFDFTDNSMGIAFGKNPYYPCLAFDQGNSTILGDAIAQPFTFFFLWAGMEDVYNYAQRGGTQEPLTDFATFDVKFDEALDGLIASGNGPHGVVANIPDLDVFPFFNFIKWNDLVLTKDQADMLNSLFGSALHFDAGPNGFVIDDSTLINFPYRHATEEEKVLLTVPTDSLKCNYVGALSPIPSHYILDRIEVAKINAAIAHFNAKIQSAAAAHNIPVVDMNAFFKQVKNGYYYNGIKFSTEFIKGAFFSLDGFHPNGQGYGLLTNEFIKTVNSFYHSNIPLVDVTRLPGVIFPSN